MQLSAATSEGQVDNGQLLELARCHALRKSWSRAQSVTLSGLFRPRRTTEQLLEGLGSGATDWLSWALDLRVGLAGRGWAAQA